MKRRLLLVLLAAARRPLLALLLLSATAVASIGALASLGAASIEATGSPRRILGRIWFDRYPEKRGDVVQIWIFFGGGIGFHEVGSAYRLTSDLFEFERQGDKVSLTFLHDKKSAETRFTISACEEKPPFDLCIDFADSPRGQKRWYGFGDEDEMARSVPWSKAILKHAEARASMR